MPRDGSNIYHRPSGTDAVPNTVVASTPYNSYTADVEQDLNLPRPIVAGGTAATSPDNALINLSAEKAKQVVTNWDATVWMPGSFYAATSATGTAPVAAHAFAGVVYYANASDFVLQAIDITDTNHPQFVRVMSAGVWGAWAADDASVYVKKTGDTMTGDLTINSAFLTVSAAAPSLNLTKSASGNASGIMSRLGAALRWIMLPGDTTAETGSNVGSDFVLQAYTDAAAPVVPPALTIKRALNRLLLAGDPVAALDAATKQYVDAGVAAAKAYSDTTDVSLAGDTMTGLLVLSGNPAVPLGAVPKQQLPLRGYLWGLTLSTAGSSTTFTTAAGAAADSTGADLLTLAASLAKTTAAWAVGAAAGSLDTGSVTINTWYFVYLIKRPDTGVVDVLISLSATTPTLPTNYTLFRRIGAIKTNASSQWILFQQVGDEFVWDVPVTDVNGSGLTNVSTLFTLPSVPPGLNVTAKFNAITSTTTGSMILLIQSPLASTQAINSPSGNISLVAPVAGNSAAGAFAVLTDNLQRVRAVASATGGTQSTTFAVTGWTDTRGRLS